MSFGKSLVGSDTWWGILSGDSDGTLPRKRIYPVLYPAMLLALAGRSGFLQHGDCPAAPAPDSRPPSLNISIESAPA